MAESAFQTLVRIARLSRKLTPASRRLRSRHLFVRDRQWLKGSLLLLLSSNNGRESEINNSFNLQNDRRIGIYLSRRLLKAYLQMLWRCLGRRAVITFDLFPQNLLVFYFPRLFLRSSLNKNSCQQLLPTKQLLEPEATEEKMAPIV